MLFNWIERILAVLILAGILIATGAAIPLVGSDSGPAVTALLSLASLPLFLWASAGAPHLAVGIIVCSQILERFEFQTPFGTISLGITALVAFLGQSLPSILRLLQSAGYRVAIVCLIAYVAGHGFQFLHVDASAALRQVITASSFAAFTLLGIYVGANWRLLSAAGVGATVALLVLAGLALATALGTNFFGAFTSPARQILGITSPFDRNYGIDTATLGLLLAPAVPWLTYVVRVGHAFWARSASAITLMIIWLASLLLFQSRSMVLEVPVGFVLTASLMNRTFVAGTMSLILGGIAIVGTGLITAGGTDYATTVSTQLRVESYAGAFDYLRNNMAVLFVGTDPTQFHLTVNASLTYGSQIPAGAPTHNLLIETIVAGGAVSVTGLILLVLSPLAHMLRTARAEGRFSRASAVALSGVVIAVFEASVTPGIANSGLFWMTLGIATAVAASVMQKQSKISDLADVAALPGRGARNA